MKQQNNEEPKAAYGREGVRPGTINWRMAAAVFLIPIVLLAPACSNEVEPAVANSEITAPEPTVTSAIPGQRCEAGSKTTTRDYAVAQEATLLVEPRNDALPIMWKTPMGEVPAPLEESATAREICRRADWSLVKIVSGFDGLQDLSGWVPSSTLRDVARRDDGRRVYVATDFSWPEGGSSSKRAVVTAINRIIDERPECMAIDTGNLVLNGRSYSVPCFANGDLKSFTFTAQDAANGRSFAPVDPLAKMEALEACVQAGRAKSTHPSTYKTNPLDVDFTSSEDGSTSVRTSFRARNSLNLELKFDLYCEFRGAVMTDLKVSEAAP